MNSKLLKVIVFIKINNSNYHNDISYYINNPKYIQVAWDHFGVAFGE